MATIDVRLSPNSQAVLDALRAKVEGHSEIDKQGREWRDVYLDNARPAGMSVHSFAGHLGTLEKAGLYHSLGDDCFGMVCMAAEAKKSEAPVRPAATDLADDLDAQRHAAKKQAIVDAPLTPEELVALQTFADNYGREWKQELAKIWVNGTDMRESHGDTLRRIRNQRGPAWLVRFNFPKAPPTRPTFHHGYKAEELLIATARHGELWMSTSAAHAVAWVPTGNIRDFTPNYSLYVYAELKERGHLRRVRRMSGDRQAYHLTADGVAAALALGVKPEELAAQYRKPVATTAA